jgi:hypothetical protein
MKQKYVAPLGLFVCLTAGWAAEIHTPGIGLVLGSNGSVFSYCGIHANLVRGEQVFSQVQSASFGADTGLISTSGKIQLVSTSGAVLSSYDTQEQAPALGIVDAPTSAIAWLPSQHALLHWNGSEFVLTQVPDTSWTGRVTSIRKLGPIAAELVTASADGNVLRILLDLHDGEIKNITPISRAHGFVFQHESFLLFPGEQGLEIQAVDGSRRTIPMVEHDLTIERMSPEWLHIRSASSRKDWALHLHDSLLELSELPEAAQ